MTIRPRLTSFERASRVGLKRFLYSQLMLREASQIARGRGAPLLEFRVEESPPSIYLNFPIDEAKLDDLRNYLDLPAGLSLAPVCCIEGDAPRYVLTLNVYRVSGLVSGLRAEWSLYVRDESGKARYLIVEARASERSLDPIQLLTPAHRVEHAVRDGSVVFRVASSSGEVRLRAPAPDPANMPCALIHREWVEANDVIYWLNGVADRVYYGGTLANALAVCIPSQAIELTDSTHWRAFLRDEPPQTVAFLGAIDLVISPWCNL